MSPWYFHCPGQAAQVGPLDQHSAQQFARRNPQALAWRDGMADWMSVQALPELRHTDGAALAAAVNGPAPPTQQTAGIDFQIVGHEMQFVEITLAPGQTVIAEAGALMFKDAAIQMETVLGTGGEGMLDGLLGAGRRALSGERLFLTRYSHRGPGTARVALAAPYPGTVLPIRLDQQGGQLVCQRDSFLAGAGDVRIGVHVQRRIMTGLFGGEGFIMQKLQGQDRVFVHAGGTVVERELHAGEQLDVDTGCVVAFQTSVRMDVRRVTGLKSMLFGGEGMFLATLAGPGKVWLQSLPFSRLAGRLQSAAQRGGKRGAAG